MLPSFDDTKVGNWGGLVCLFACLFVCLFVCLYDCLSGLFFVLVSFVVVLFVCWVWIGFDLFCLFACVFV